MVISWFIRVFPVRINDGGATSDCEASSLLMADKLRAFHTNVWPQWL